MFGKLKTTTHSKKSPILGGEAKKALRLPKAPEFPKPTQALRSLKPCPNCPGSKRK